MHLAILPRSGFCFKQQLAGGSPTAAMGDSKTFEDDDSVAEVPLTTCLRPPVPFPIQNMFQDVPICFDLYVCDFL